MGNEHYNEENKITDIETRIYFKTRNMNKM